MDGLVVKLRRNINGPKKKEETGIAVQPWRSDEFRPGSSMDGLVFQLR